MVRSIPRICASLEDRQVEHQSHMIEVEGNIINNHVAIVINLGASHFYIDPKIVDIFHWTKIKLERSWLVQLANGTKRRINEIIIGYPISLNRVNTNDDINIIPLEYYDILIGMDWLDKNHVVLDCHNKTFTCLDEEGKQSIVSSKTHLYKGDFSLTSKEMFQKRVLVVCNPCGGARKDKGVKP